MLLHIFVAAIVASTVPSSLWRGDVNLASSPGSGGSGDAPTSELSRRRQLSEGHPDSRDHPDSREDEGDEPSEWGRWWVYDPLIRLGALLLTTVVTITVTAGYWHIYIRETPGRFVPARAVVPDDLKGRWAHGLWACCEAPGTCLCFAFCPSCAIADLWYRAGWVHAVLGRPDQESPCGSCCGGCPGWQYFVGYLGIAFLYSFECCAPCGLAVLRGGARFIDGGERGPPGVEDHRKRFGLPHEGWSTFCQDCCLWCWCSPCVGTQEWRQISDLLGRGPLEQGAAPGVIQGQVIVGQVVGTPVAVQANMAQ